MDAGVLVGSVVLLQLANDPDEDTAWVDAVAWTPAVAFLVGGPTVHAIHGEYRRALGSLGLRTGLPTVGTLGTFAVADCSGGDFGCGLGAALVGGALGAVAASLIDGCILARRSTATTRSALSLAPFVSADGTTQELRLRGYF